MPVRTSAYAASAIANSNPFRTGISAFTLGLGEVVAPLAFVYVPVLLFVSSAGFELWEFAYTSLGRILGVTALSASVVGYLFVPMKAPSRILMTVSGVVLIALSLQADFVILAIAMPALIVQFLFLFKSRSLPHNRTSGDGSTSMVFLNSNLKARRAFRL